MSKIRIVTDSTVDLSLEQAAQYGIEIVPLTVTVNGISYRDKYDISNNEFYQLMQNAAELPTTSQVTPAVFTEVYQHLAQDGAEHIVSIHLSSDLSGTYQSSVLAANMVQDVVKVHCIDSRTATIGLGLIVLAAARLAKSGMDIDTLLEQLQQIVQKTDLYFLIDSLDNLHKGGRIGKASHLFGSLLNIKPILRLNEGVISAYEKVRGNKGNKALERLIDILLEKIDPDKEVYCVIGYCDNLELSQHIQERLEGQINCNEFVYMQIGSVVGTHIGMGAIGMAFYQL